MNLNKIKRGIRLATMFRYGYGRFTETGFTSSEITLRLFTERSTPAITIKGKILNRF